MDRNFIVGCILELTTKLFSKRNIMPESEEPLTRAGRLVEHFKWLPAAKNILLTLQVAANKTPQLQCLQNVRTRRWSTYSMNERLVEIEEIFCSYAR